MTTRLLELAKKAEDLKARLMANRFKVHGDCCEESGDGAVPCASIVCAIEYEAETLLGELAIALLSSETPPAQKWEWENPDDESLSITRCVCGAKHERWTVVAHPYEDEPLEMPCCGRRIIWSQTITITDLSASSGSAQEGRE